MLTSNSSEQPAWQRNAIFEFFASLKLAVVLLTMLIIAAIAGTLYESSFDAKVARAYVYGAPWFNLWPFSDLDAVSFFGTSAHLRGCRR